MHDYWKTQSADKPLFADVAWSKPEQRSQAGRLGIIGGNKLGFVGIAAAYSTALETGVGAVRVLLPEALRSTIPPIMTDVVFGAANPSGSLAKDALPDMHALAAWGTMTLLIGDAGRNSETAITYETFLKEHEGPVVITRDAIDLIKHDSMQLAERPNTMLVMSFAQLQKLFQLTYYPKILTFSMQLAQLVDNLHKFTSTYPTCIVVFHKDTLIVAHQGEVTTTAFDSPMLIWRGLTAAQAAAFWMWNPSQPLQAATASILAG